MKLSIITPCYNSEKFISETIESVIYQKGNFDIEYILVDGKSNDGTIEIVNRYIEKNIRGDLEIRCNDLKIKFISEKDNGMYDALVKGIKDSTGDIIAYINSDDFYLPNAFSTVAEVFENNRQVQWITGINTNYNEEGQIITMKMPFKYNKKFIRGGVYGKYLPYIQQESTFWKRKLLDDIDLNKLKSYKLAGDYYLWNSFAINNELIIVKSALAGFRIVKGQLSSDCKKYMKEFDSICDDIRFYDYFMIFLYKILWACPDKIKIKLNKNICVYNKNIWKIKIHHK